MNPVLFVGAGPGDPDLLTIRARKAIESADLVLHDELVTPEICALARDARRYEGTESLVQAARTGGRVVRLQIGDPTIFGRLTEQMEALDAAGIPYGIVPGVTAATAAAAAARISLTHRALGRSIAIVSAHDESIPIPDADTVVYYMGRPAASGPTIVVENATRANQRVLRDPAQAVAPSVVIRGAVADLKSLPLYERRIVVTRAESSRLNLELRRLGADVIEFPVIQIVPPLDDSPLRRAVEELPAYDWLIFTSANGVRRFFDLVQDLRTLRARICAIGPATAAEIEKWKLLVDIQPAEYVGEALASALPENLTGQRILLPRAAVARDVVPQMLRDRGAIVDVVEAYRTVIPEHSKPLPEQFDWVTFTSSSTVKNFLALAGPPKGRTASIGPVTSATLRMHGITPDVEAQEYTTEGLVAAILRHEKRQ